MKLIMSDNLRKMMEREQGFVIEKNGLINSNINIDMLSSSDELIEELMKRNSISNNEIRDKEAILNYLNLRNSGFNSAHYYFEGNNSNMDTAKASKYGDEAGVMISGVERRYSPEELSMRGKFDYRITMRGSNKMTTEEALAFTDTLVREARLRHLNVRMKDPWTHDAVILYVYQDELLEVVKLLEELRNSHKYGDLVESATNHFGKIIPYSATVNDEAYYGISMAHSELRYNDSPRRLMGSYGGGFGDTFGSYIENVCLNKTYDELISKYHGDKNKITVNEMYQGLIIKHKNYMLGNSESDIPLWMNRRNYMDAKKNIRENTVKLYGSLVNNINHGKGR